METNRNCDTSGFLYLETVIIKGRALETCTNIVVCVSILSKESRCFLEISIIFPQLIRKPMEIYMSKVTFFLNVRLHVLTIQAYMYTNMYIYKHALLPFSLFLCLPSFFQFLSLFPTFPSTTIFLSLFMNGKTIQTSREKILICS